MKILMALLLMGSFTGAFAGANDGLGEGATDNCTDVVDSKLKDKTVVDGTIVAPSSGTSVSGDGK